LDTESCVVSFLFFSFLFFSFAFIAFWSLDSVLLPSFSSAGELLVELLMIHKLQLLSTQLEPLTEQQLSGIGNLQQSSQQAEDALSQGMEALQQSLAETLAGSLSSSGSTGNVANYMGQMAMAMGKLGTLENFLRQVFTILLECIFGLHKGSTVNYCRPYAKCWSL
jgi:hypothetical protein